jgi:hypothetical protein
LRYNIHSPTHKHLHHSIFNEIARTRLQLNILPNLNTLDWITGNMQDVEMNIVFMHEQVKRFVVGCRLIVIHGSQKKRGVYLI